jgi:hypothetical protein
VSTIPETGRIRWEPTEYGFVGNVGTEELTVFRLWPQPPGKWNLAADLPGDDLNGPDPDKLKDDAEKWLEEVVLLIGAAFDLASTCGPEVSACRFCNALLRRSGDGLYYDIDLNRTRDPEPWQCSGRYVASPGGRHKPLGRTGDGEPR